MRPVRAGALAGLALAAALLAQPLRADPIRFEVAAEPLSSFRMAGLGDETYGPLRFVGGLVLTGARPEFGQLSGLRFLTPGTRFIGVADHGYWFSGAIERDAAGKPSGISGFMMEPMVGAAGRPLEDKHFSDAEGLSVTDGVATASFEREARLAEYEAAPGAMGPPLRDLDFLVPKPELRYNAGLETVAKARAGGPLAGARIVIAERSIDRAGNIFAAIIEGPLKGVFKVRRTDEFDVTDGVFLPGGDLLILERRFSYLRGVAMRLRRIAEDDLRPGATVDGETLIEANMAYQVDNMEAIDVWRRGDGALIVSLLSDDNQSWLQRTLYLEFVLDED